MTHSDIDEFQAFISFNFSKEHIFSIEKTVLNWQHKNTENYHYLIAKKDGKIVGIHGVIPMSQYDESLPTNQIFPALWKVNEKEGIAIGLRLFKAVLDKYKPELTINSGIDPRLISFHKSQGFYVSKMDHYVIFSPFVDSYNIAINVPRIDYKEHCENTLLVTKKLTINDFVEYNFDKLYSQRIPTKSNSYIINRYFKHPIYDYDVFGIFKNNIVIAICVIRRVVVGRASVLRLVDYIGDNKSFSLLNSFFIRLLKESKAEYCDFYVYGIPENIIIKAGFVNRKLINSLIVPNYFEPIKRINIDILFGIRTLNDISLVRFFKGDGDQDRPSQLSRKGEYE